MGRQPKKVLNKQTGEYGVWVMANRQPVFIADGQTLDQALERLNKQTEYRQNTPYTDIADNTIDIYLDGEEIDTLRSEVFRKNVAHGDDIHPINCAFTANHFVVYETSGGDDYRVVKVLDIETERTRIKRYRKLLGDYNE